MPKVAGVNHRRAVRAFGRAGFGIIREGRKHIVMSDGVRILTIPRNNPINAYTMGAIARDAGLSEDSFRKLL
ncbi:MAG: type II toxin-antitoxin system HicA family toxin [Gammaproteobacteria bacterium]